MIRLKQLVLFIVLFCVVTSLCFAKSFHITDVNIDCTILEDSRVQWKEKRSFYLEGPFSYGYYDLPKTGYDWIREIVVGEKNVPYELNETKTPGSFFVEELTDAHRIHFYYDAENENRTFDIDYYIEGGIDLYVDYGQFYWKLQGANWGSSVVFFKTTIHLEKPVPKKDMKVWAHGPLNGVVTIVDEKTILLEASDVPAYSFVEVRLLVPIEYFSVKPSETTLIAPVALQEEAAWVKEANEIRTIAIKEHRWKTFWKWFWNIAIYGLAFFLFFYVLFLYTKYGIEHRSLRRYDYIREPPSIPPAEVGYLIRFNELHPNTIQAILLDLIRRKYIQQNIGDGKQFLKNEIVLIKDDKNGEGPLKEYEKTFLYEILFRDKSYQNQPKTSLKILKQAMKSSPFKFYLPIEKFKQELVNAVKENQFFDLKSQNLAEFIIALCTILFIFLLIFGLIIPGKYVYLLPILIIFLWFMGDIGITRRSKKGKALFDECMAFKKFLLDFTQLNAVEANSIVLWEKYLIYSVILGVSKKVIDTMQIKLQLMDTSDSNLLHHTGTNWATSFMNLTSTSLALGSSIRRLTRPSSSSGSSGFSSSSVHFSSYSGGGGGFSGGGGGGGGGSGGGMG